MAIRSQYFDSVSGDKIYDSADFSRHLETLSTNGYVYGKDSELEVIESSPNTMSVKVSLGGAWVEGRYFEVYSSNESITIPAADPTNDRIDRVVVRLDLANREVLLASVEGSPAVTPSPPSLTRDSSTYELSLAQVYITAGTTAISNTNITDERNDNAVCGVSLHSGAKASLVDVNYCELTKSSIQSGIGTGFTQVLWGNEIQDTSNMHDGVNPERINIPKTGIYQINCSVYISGLLLTNGEDSTVRLSIQSSTGLDWNIEIPVVGFESSSLSTSTRLNVSGTMYLTSGSYIYANVYIGSAFTGSSVDIETDSRISVLKVIETTL